MPLTELLKLSKKKVEEGTSTSTCPTSRPDSDCVELVWENGQIMMQGKSRKSSNATDSQTNGPRQEESRNPNSSKVTKFSTMDSIMADFPLSAPSCEMNVDQDVDLVPWLTYPMEEPLNNDYTSEFLHELSGVTINDLPSENQLGYSNKKGNFQGDNGHDNNNNNSLSFKHGIISKIPSSNEKDNNRGETKPSSLSAFTTLRLQKLDGGGVGQPSTNNSGVTNFPYFSWPSSLSKKFENDNKRCTLSVSNAANSTLVNLDSGCSQKEMVSNNQSIMESANRNSEVIPTKPSEELFSAKQALIRENIPKNYEQQNQVCDRNLEPVIATSSVCSANSAERGSDEPARNLKRKSRETTESSGPSEEIEEESVGVKKRVSARMGSKRSRAAEVHNLSERRRRDRINEKMRALQELIPNCNKADKASMLDEAIEYLKTLQLQVQMLSMGAGVYMQPMMLPPGMQPIHGLHMPHFSPMGMGMGFNMLNMNNGVKMVPFQGSHYPVPGLGGPAFPGMMGSTLQAFPHPGQGLPMAIQQAPGAPAPMSVGPLKMPMGLNGSNVARSSDAAHLGQLTERKDSNPQTIPRSGTSNYLNKAPNQASNEGVSGVQPSTLCGDQSQGVNPTEKAKESANGKDDMLT